MKNRIIWVDWSKAVLIVLVVLAHTKIPNTLFVLICGFHMPAFFMISGYLHKCSEGIYDGIKKNVKRLIIPAISFSALCYPLWLFWFLRHNPFSWHSCVVKPILGLIVYDLDIATPICSVIWFLVTLFICYILLDLVVGKCKRMGGVICLALLSVICTVMINHFDLVTFKWFYYVERVVFSFPFVALGYIARQYNFPFVIARVKMPVRVVIIIFGLVAYTMLSLFNGRVGIHSGVFGKSVVLYYFISLLGSVSFYNVMALIRNSNKIIETLSIGTIIILCLHKSLISIFFYHICANPYVVTIMVMTILYPVCLFFNHYDLYWFTGVKRSRQ